VRVEKEAIRSLASGQSLCLYENLDRDFGFIQLGENLLDGVTQTWYSPSFLRDPNIHNLDSLKAARSRRAVQSSFPCRF
jgi:hypothetical protein